jgi:hypothetical protein
LKEDPNPQKGSKIAKPHVFPLFWSAGGSENMLKVAGAELSCQIRDRKLHVAVAQSHLKKYHSVRALLDLVLLKKYTRL